MDKIKQNLNELINKIIKHDNIFMLITIIIATSISFIYMNLEVNDELWEFSNIYKMYNGFEIYKEINVIQTPLYFYIGKFVFQLFGANYLIYRIYDRIILKTILIFSMYILLKKLKISKKDSIIITLIVIIINIYHITTTYNFLAITFITFGMLCEKLDIKSYKKSIFQGIIIFLVFLSKQNIGIYYMFGIILYIILKDDVFKDKIVYIIRTFLISAICLVLFCIYLYSNNILNDALNYVMGGLGEFSSKNHINNYMWVILIGFYAIIEIMFIIFTFIPKFKIGVEQKNNIILISSIALFENLIIFPLVNRAHAFYATYLFLLSFLYTINFMFLNDVLTDSRMQNLENWTIVIIIMIFIIGLIYTNVKYILKLNCFDKTSPYYGADADEDTMENINKICQYIEIQRSNNIDIKIISYYSDLYFNLFKENNGKFDLPFYGNLGRNGENSLIEDIKNLHNTNILILTEADDKYQEAKGAMEYIKNNFEYKGEIEQFSIYYKE